MVVLDLEGVNFVDSQGSAKLAEIREFLGVEGIELRLARLKPQILAVLRADGVLDRIGVDHVHGNVERAVQAERTSLETQV
jgi:anti-anti-sigma regulatory factor